KRFRYDRYLQRSVKINSYMSYNETLDMSEFCEHPEEDARYKLSASIVHVGNTPRSGHYYAYAKTASGWVKFNDNMTSNNLKFISSNPDTETNTLSCNIIKHVTEKQSDVSLNDKVPISIQSSVVESMNSINTDMKSNTSVFEYGQCRWVVESVPSLNSLNNNWKEKFSQVRNKTIRKRRKGKLRGRVNLQDVEKES
ncbi:3417_t:CDS:2, partial [Scutellospora calospora]